MQIYRPVRAINSDRGKVVSGSDDQSVIVWDKQTTQLLEELKGHDAQVFIIVYYFIFLKILIEKITTMPD